MSTSEDIEKEVIRRVALIVKDIQQELDDMRDKYVAADFRASVAEWAVAGVMSRNVRFCVAPEELADKSRLYDLSQHFARQAAAMLLHDADLAFRQHSELWELKARAGSLTVRYRDPMATTPPPKESWPKPFGTAKHP